MTIRDLETTALPTPPDGLVAIAVARHLTPTAPHPDMETLHRRRARLLHELVDEHGLEVRDWGATDAEHPSEIVELLVGIGAPVVSAVATVIAAWIVRPQRPVAETKGLLGVKIKRPDGAELQLTHRDEKTPAELAGLVESFLAGGARPGARDAE